MSDLISFGCLVCLAALPLVVLGLRATRPTLMPWWAVFSIVIGMGWMLALVSAMLNEVSEGGSGHVFALFFGWAIELVWFAPWLLMYALIQFFRQQLARRNA